MSFDGSGYFKGKLPPNLLLVDNHTPSWEMPCRFLLALFQDPGGYGIPEKYHNDLERVQATFFPTMTSGMLDVLVDDWVASNNHQEKTMLKFVAFQALPHVERRQVGAGPAEVTAIYCLGVQFHDTYTQLFTTMDAVAYIFSIADPPEGVALTPESFFLPFLHEFAQFLYFLHPNQDACPKVMCIVMLKSSGKMQWLLGTSLGRFKPDDITYWDSELKSELAGARWAEMSRLLGLDPEIVAPLAGSVEGYDWGHCAESLPFACLLKALDSRSETVWGSAIRWEGSRPKQSGGSIALEGVEAVRVTPCENCQMLLTLKNVENYSKFQSHQTSSNWRERSQIHPYQALNNWRPRERYL